METEEKITINELKKISQEFREKASDLLRTSCESGMRNLNRLINFIRKNPILNEFIQRQVNLYDHKDELKSNKSKSAKSLLDSIASEGEKEKEVSLLYQFLERGLEYYSSSDDTGYFNLAQEFIDHRYTDKKIQSITDKFNKDIIAPHFVNHITSYLNTLINNHQQQTEGKSNRIINTENYIEQSGPLGIGHMGGGEIKDNANVSGVYRPINTKAKGNKFMSENTQPNVTQNIGTNTGQAQAIAAGGDVNASQVMNQREDAEEITQEEAVELLTQIEELIKTANLPSEVVKEATKYVGKAKEEAEEKEPQQPIVISQLDRATKAIKKLDTTADVTLDLINKLKPLLVKLAGWLGVAVSNFWG